MGCLQLETIAPTHHYMELRNENVKLIRQNDADFSPRVERIPF